MLRKVCSFIVLSAAVLIAALPGSALSQDKFPSRPITIVVPVGAGSGVDSGTRIVAELMAKELAIPVVVENKPGAETLIGVQAVLKAPADGYSLLVISPTSMVLNPLVKDKLPYDAARDFRPIGLTVRGQAALVVSAESKINNVADLLRAAREKPRAVSMANYSTHYKLGAAVFEKAANVEFNHVPYNGPSPVVTNIIGGTVDAAFIDVAGVTPMVAGGKLRAIAVSGNERNGLLPAVPTVKEQGIDFSHYVWVGLGLRRETPEPIVKLLEEALRKAVASGRYVEYQKTVGGGDIVTANGAELAEQIAAETARYKGVVKTLETR